MRENPHMALDMTFTFRRCHSTGSALRLFQDLDRVRIGSPADTKWLCPSCPSCSLDVTERRLATEFSWRIQTTFTVYIRDTSREGGIRRNECDGNKVIKLHKTCKPNTIVAKVEYWVHISEECVADDPEFYHPWDSDAQNERGELTKIIRRGKATPASAWARRFGTKVECRGADLKCFSRESNGDRSVIVARHFPNVDQLIYQRANSWTHWSKTPY